MDLKLLQDQIETRRSIRKYKDEKLSDETKEKIRNFCDEINTENFMFVPVFDEPECFKSKIATFGLFKNVKNYIVVKSKVPLLSKRLIEIGYFGGTLLLFLRSLSVGSCWCGKTFSRNKCKINLSGNEEIVSVISIGVPLDDKKGPRYSKSLNEVSSYLGEAPEWFLKGCHAALKAPTALNRQDFKIRGTEEGVEFFLKKEDNHFSLISFGIVKRFFELGAYPEEIKYKN